MGNSIWSNYAGNRALAYNLGQSGLYLAVHVSDPGVLGDLSTEVAGGGYLRQPITFSDPSGKACVNTIKAYFSGMPIATAEWLAVWDSPGAGNMIARHQLTPTIDVDEDGQLRVEAGDLAFAS